VKDMSKYFTAFVFLVLLIFDVHGTRKYEFKALDYSGEIFSDQIFCFYQDMEGFMWIGTANGLYRYNGINYDQFFHVRGDTTSISSNDIETIAEDAEGNLWVGTSNGLNRYNRRKNEFQWFLHDELDTNTISSNQISSFKASVDGYFYIGTGSGLNRMIVDDDGGVAFRRFYPERRNNTTKSELSIQDIYEAPDSSLWTSTWGGGILHFNRSSGKFTNFLPPVKGNSFNDFAITDIEMENDSIIWASSYSGYIYTFNINKKDFHVFPHFHPLGQLKDQHLSIYSLERDKEGKLWIGTSISLYVYDHVSGKMVHEGTPAREGVKRIKDNANYIYQDKNGMIWVAYSNNGIDIHDPEPNELEEFRYPLNTDGKYRDYIKNIVIDDNGNYWLSTWGDGLIRSDPSGNVMERIMFSEFTSQPGNDIITAMEIDPSGNLLIGTQHGLLYYNPKKKKVEDYYFHNPNDPFSLSDNHIYRIFPDGDGRFWIISQESIRLFDARQEKLERAPFLEKMKLVKIGCILKDSRGNYWLGTYSNGLFFYDARTESYTIYKSDPGNSNSLCSNEIKWLFEDSGGKIWIATNNGLCNFDREKGVFLNFHDIPELSLKTFSFINEDHAGNIWALGYTDLIVYNPDEHSIITYGVNDGLSSLADNLTKDKNGNILITDEKGFYRIKPDNIGKTNVLSPVYLTGLYIQGKKVAVQEKPLSGIGPMYKKKVTLAHDQNNFGFDFVAIEYRHASKTRYEYKLAGYNDSWIKTGTKNHVSFMNLPPGKYSLLVRTVNNPGNFASIDVQLLPPPWKTTWAYALYILLIFVLILTYRNFTIKRERKKSKRFLDQMKLNFFINISHELRTPLTLVTGPLESLVKTEKDIRNKEKLKVVYRNASRMQRLIDQILDLRKIESPKQQPVGREMNFIHFMNELLYSFKAYAEDNGIHLQLKCRVTDQTMWFDPNILEKTFSNILINAFKYSKRNDNIVIQVFEYKNGDVIKYFDKYKYEMHLVKSRNKIRNNKTLNRFIAVEIVDQGPGLQEKYYEEIFERFYQNDFINGIVNNSGSGIGLSLTRELIRLINGFIFIKSEPGRGTKFVLFFPVSKDDYKIIDQNGEDYFQTYQSLDYTGILTDGSLDDNEGNQLTGVEEQPGINNKDRASILLVDDNPELLNYLSEILSKDYIVTLAENGEKAFQLAINRNFDLIVSDIMMPVMDGMEFCKKIKEDFKTSHIPFILLTAKSSPENEMEGLDSGADDYISKPFNENIFVKRVKNSIKNREKIWEKLRSDSEIIPRDIGIGARDKEFLEKAVAIVETHLSSPGFNQDAFSRELGMSKASLYRKINGLTNQSVNEFVRNIRLKKAAEILRGGEQIHIGELTYHVGFSEPSYFTKKFRELFGVTPKAYNNKFIDTNKKIADQDK
jgi:ligand-binding sensor domain-containing protein/signal transduction histidine kinase/DNA-binding NarL/FixJ family response regulator